MTDNLAQLDRSGSNCQWVRAYLGPSVGWVMLPVVPELIITSAAALDLSLQKYQYASRVLLQAAVVAVSLPSVSAWVLAKFQANQSAFDRSIWIKDYGYNASIASPIVITPNGADTIDTLASFKIVSAGALIRLYPLTDLTGWFVG